MGGAPKRICLDTDGKSWFEGDPQFGNPVQYVRADLSDAKDARIAELERMKSELVADKINLRSELASVKGLNAELVEAINSYKQAESAAADTGLEDDYLFVFECWDKVDAALDALAKAKATT